MASTYTTIYGVEKITTGEQSGTWGTTENYNWDMMDRFGGFKKITVSTTTSTLYSKTSGTPTDGASHLQDGQYRVIEYYSASDIGDNTTVTIDPNSAPVHYVVKNNLAGSRSLILSAGTGANVTVQSGKSTIVYSDGAGSGAAVTNALANLQIATLECTGAAAIDGTATINTLNLTTVLGVAYGGSGLTSYTAGDLVYASGTTTIAKLAKGTASQVLQMNSGASAPEWTTRTDFIPPGGILPYSGASAPTGYLLCLPSLSDQFPIGKGSTFSTLGETGGSTTVDITPSGTNAGTAITTAQLPAHAHDSFGSTLTSWSGGTGSSVSVSADQSSLKTTDTVATLQTLETGSGQTHTHTFTGAEATHTITNPYITLNYIIKT
jgi:microcystin-dependent protein